MNKFKFYGKNKNGMMLPLVLFAVMLVGSFALYFHNYRMMQVKMSSSIGNFYNALNIAEAGMNAAITEMSTQFNWKTHQTQGTAGNTEFTSAIKHDNAIKGGGVLEYVSGSKGTYYGQLGDYGEFKVKVGIEKIAGDNPTTKTVNEDYMFYRIESIGKYGNYYQKITAIIQKRILSEEYLLYDNDFLDMVLGVNSKGLGDNIFNIGSLYGRRYVFLGTNQKNTPKLEIKNATNISTAGELYVWDNYVKVNGSRLSPSGNSSYSKYKLNNGGSLVKPGEGDFVVRQDKDINKNFAKNGKNVLKDANNGGKLEILNFDEIFPKFAIKAKTKGLFITKGTNVGYEDNLFENPYPEIGNPQDIKHIDFGEFGDGDSALGTLPSDYNGIIYSMVPLRVRGCPDVDTVIVSDKDIYVCGDFNQSSKVIQSYKTTNLLEYMPNPLTGKDYFKEDREFRENNPDKKYGLHRNRCKIISRQKIWYDYTRPDFVYKNELLPFIEFQLCTLLTKKGSGYSMMQDIKDEFILVRKTPGDLIQKIQDAADAGKTDDEILALPDMQKIYLLLTKKATTLRNQENAAPRTNSIYCEYYGKDEAAAKNFLKEKIKYTDKDGNDIEASFIDMCRDGKLDPDERRNMTLAVWEAMTKSFEKDGQYSSLWDLPQRLLDITKSGGDFSQFNNSLGIGPKCQKDKLMIPEMTINAKLISSDTRNGLWKIGKTTRAIYNEIGNPKPSWTKPKNAGYYRYIEKVSGILRILGGEIFLRIKKCEPNMIGGVYQPHCRKKVFDIELIGFEDENAIPLYSIVDFDHTKVEKKDWNNF